MTYLEILFYRSKIRCGLFGSSVLEVAFQYFKKNPGSQSGLRWILFLVCEEGTEMKKERCADAVADRIREMTAELKGVMAFTGVRDMAGFDSSVLHLRTFG